MTTSLLDRVPVKDITAQAREVRFGHTMLLWLAAALYALGWSAAKVLGSVWLGLAWSWTAIRVGWEEARNPVAVEEPQDLVAPGPPGMSKRNGSPSPM